MSNIDKRAYSVSQIIADLKLKHGSGDTYAPIMRWDELLALLDELEALKLANAAQDDHTNQQQDRIDLLEKGNNEAARQINSWRRLAKQNIAEREKDVSELNIARKRIAELEAREVVLPQRYSMLHRVDFDEPYHTEMVYKQHQVLEALHDAGVNVAAAAKGEAS
ncbi:MULTISPECIES: hypothetical protein [Enterobacteriaceae]|uniref:hypothetical protein n=1 Tax=Enterobacteriaceae TaxID=543 RepID=UPI001F49502D|nr:MULTISPECIES: hypothetical protein [Enterobacteriaceae]